MHVRSNLFARLLCPRRAGSIAVEGGAVTLELKERNSLRVEDLLDVRAMRGLLGATLSLTDRNGAVARIAGLPWGKVPALRAAILESQLDDVSLECASTLAALLNKDGYLTGRQWKAWHERAVSAMKGLPGDWSVLPLRRAFHDRLTKLTAWLRDGQAGVQERNERFMHAEIERYGPWLDTFEKYPLTPQQKRAVVCNESNNLVVAGAGSGKTSTLAARARYLAHRGFAQPASILLLAFARKARDEMEGRLAEHLGPGFQAHTFHSLGLRILAEVEDAKPSLSPLVEDPEALPKRIDEHLAAIIEDTKHRQIALDFLGKHRFPQRDERDFKTEHTFYQYLRSNGIRSLRGELVKSYGELRIADFLTMHQVDYRYEADYEHRTATASYRQYKPDFYLPGSGIYIEYFGVDRAGNTASFIDNRAYRESMEWKRTLHAQHGTKLVELNAYDLFEGRLEEVLEHQLVQQGVELKDVAAGELLVLLGESKETSRISRLLATFLNLFRSNQWSIPELKAKARQGPAADRALAFLDLFELIHGRYVEDLLRSKTIDFHDMIGRATEYVASGRFQSPFTHILVDELQDLSRGRARMLKALQQQQPDGHLFGVGDDWQSIYRFTGSDVGLMQHFAKEFGPSARTDLTETFRFPQELLDASSRFVLKNPAQLRKSLSARQQLGRPPIAIEYAGVAEAPGAALSRVLTDVARRAGAEETHVMLLGRYRFTKPEDFERLKSQFPTLRLEFGTAHSAKGLEADYVIVLDCNSGRYGFPSEVQDDPLLDLVLGEPEAQPNAEERRLFYVALTRARRQVFILASEATRSKFLEELEGEEFAGLVISTGNAKQLPCPKCQGGRLVMRRARERVFWGCSNYPYCDGSARTCRDCGKGAFVREGGTYRCSNADCGAVARACPRCSDGFLVARTGKYGRFYGCTNFSREDQKCRYTQQAADKTV